MGYRTYTTAQVYPLGGEEKDQLDVTTSAILNAVISSNDADLAGAIRHSNTNSSAHNLRRFYKYVSDNNPDRLLSGDMHSAVDIDMIAVSDELRTVLGLSVDETVQITEAFIDHHDADYFAEGWLMENRQGVPREAWEAAVVNDNLEIQVQDEEGLIEIVTIPLPSLLTWAWETGGRILYAFYNVVYQDPVSGISTISTGRLYTYQLGSGANLALDALAIQDVEVSGFYPVYFLRWFNQSVSEFPDDYNELRKAYRLLSGGSVDALLDSVESNQNIADIDFCYLFHGVSLGTTNQASLAYLFEFFDALRETQTVSKSQHNASKVRYVEYAAHDVYNSWMRETQQGNIYNISFKAGLASAPHPPYAGYPQEQSLLFTPVGDTGYTLDNTKFRFGLKWSYFDKQLYSGNAKGFPGVPAREALTKGEYWLARGSDQWIWVLNRYYEGDREGGNWVTEWVRQPAPTVYLFHQYDDFRYRVMELANLRHENYIYKSHKEVTEAHIAIGVTNSPFLVPLHEPTLNTFSMSQRATLSNSSSYLVFNAYERVKVKWYETGIFKALLIVGALFLAGPAGFGLVGSSAGVLGTNIAVGTALGLTGTAAIVAGAAANMVAAMLITKIITIGATELLGEEWGAVVGAIVSFFALQMTSNYFETGSFSFDWTSMMQPENLLRLTDAAVSGYQHMLNIQTGDIYGEMKDLERREEEETEKIQDLWDELMPDTSDFNPLLLVDSTVDYGESRDTFLGRTLMTGSDIASLSTGYITDFVSVNLKLPDAIA